MADRRNALQRIARAVARRVDSPIAAPPMATVLAGPRKSIRERVDSIRNTFLGIGDDKVQAGRPDVYRIPLSDDELSAIWRYGGHARRFVELPPADATRKGWTVKAGEDAVTDLDKEHQRLNLFANVCEADTWGRLRGGGYILMVTTDDRTATKFETNAAGWTREPLDLRRVRSLDNLVVFDKREVTPIEVDNDIGSPTFGRPLRYRISANVGGRYGSGLEVHASRLLYFWGSRLPRQDRLWNYGVDDSVLQSVWDQMRNTATLSHSIAAIVAEMRISVLKMRDLSDVQVADEAAYFDYRMRELAKHKSVVNTVLLGDGEEYQHVSGTVAGMAELKATTQQDLQAVTGMPEQVWLGSAPGGLNTDGDSHRQLWANVISSYQTVKLEPILVPFYRVLFAAQEGPWKGVAPDGWALKFNPLDELTENGVADLRKKVAETDAIYIMAGVLDPARVARARFGERGWQMDIPPDDSEVPTVGGLNMAEVEKELAANPVENTPIVDVAKLQALVESAKSGAIPVGTLAPMIRASFQGLMSPEDIAEIIRELRAELGQPEPVRDPVTGAPVVADVDDEEEPQPSAAEALAAHLTELQVERCEHGSLNRCLKCGIERDRAVKTGPDGQAMRDPEGNVLWELRWRPVAKADRKDRRAAPQMPSRHRDADDTVSIWVGLPLPASARPAWEVARLKAAVVAGVTVEDLDLRGHEPHVTLFWVGKVPKAEKDATVAKVKGTLDELLEHHRVIDLQGTGLGSFAPSPGSEGDTPLYLGLASSALHNLHVALGEKLLTEDEREKRPWYCPHATVGYFAGELTDVQWTNLWNARTGRGKWTADTIELRAGNDVVGTWVLDDRRMP